jgi:hypothetical protein
MEDFGLIVTTSGVDMRSMICRAASILQTMATHQDSRDCAKAGGGHDAPSARNASPAAADADADAEEPQEL